MQSEAQGWFLFPGQGAQAIGMARDVYEAGGYARTLFEEAGDVLGFDLAALVFEGTDEDLAKTENCQPALLVASIALLETLRERHGVRIDGAMGLSLGEYTALVALGSIDIADAVRLVRLRGELMTAAGDGADATMASILGLDDAVVEDVCREASEAGLVVPANYNCPGQLVISGTRAGVERAVALAKERGARRAMELNVSSAFHSPLMESAREALADALQEVTIREPDGRFINNADAAFLKDPGAIRESLARQLVSPVRWTESCRFATGQGARVFFEVGPGAVCKGLMKRIDKEAVVHSLATLADIDSLRA